MGVVVDAHVGADANECLLHMRLLLCSSDKRCLFRQDRSSAAIRKVATPGPSRQDGPARGTAWGDAGEGGLPGPAGASSVSARRPAQSVPPAAGGRPG